MTPQGPAVLLRGAAAAAGGRTVWTGVDLDIPRGEFVAILGPNGVGKSTLLKAVLGILPLTAGSARVLGAAPGEASRRIGYIPQRRHFEPGVRIRGRDIVRLGLDGHRWGLPLPTGRADRARAERVAEVIDLVGATGYADRPIGELSGGEQQRLLIAQALARGPELLALDEPLDSLDLPNAAAVSELVARICRERGVTVLMVAHDVNPILRFLHRVVYLAPAGIISGPPREVITAEQLTRLYGTPIEVLRTSADQLVVVGAPDQAGLHGPVRGRPAGR